MKNSPLSFVNEVKRRKRLYLILVILMVTVMQWPSDTSATAFANGAAGTETDTDIRIIPEGTSGSGGTCVNVVAGPRANPGAGAPCSHTVGTVFKVTVIGKGSTALKGTGQANEDKFSNSVSIGGTTSSGEASWEWRPAVLLDSVTYETTTSIVPPPGPALRFEAQATAFDPLTFNAIQDGVLGVKADLKELELVITERAGSTVGFGMDYLFDGATLFELHIGVPALFSSADDILLTYVSVLGPAFDAAMTADIFAHLTIDPILGTVALGSPLTIFPRTEFSFGAGGHETAAGIATFAVVVAEPSTIFLFLGALGALCCVAHVRRRQQGNRGQGRSNEFFWARAAVRVAGTAALAHNSDHARREMGIEEVFAEKTPIVAGGKVVCPRPLLRLLFKPSTN